MVEEMIPDRKKIILLDYDMKYIQENVDKIKEWIKFASDILDIKVKNILCDKSNSGNIHCYVYTYKEIKPLEHIMFELYAGSDYKRIKANWKRIKYNYPIDFKYLFSSYLVKPNINKSNICDYEDLDIFILSYAVKYINKIIYE